MTEPFDGMHPIEFAVRTSVLQEDLKFLSEYPLQLDVSQLEIKPEWMPTIEYLIENYLNQRVYPFVVNLLPRLAKGLRTITDQEQKAVGIMMGAEFVVDLGRTDLSVNRIEFKSKETLEFVSETVGRLSVIQRNGPRRKVLGVLKAVRGKR